MPIFHKTRAAWAATATLLTALPAAAERGADGEVRLLLAQAPTTMNVYLSGGTKDLMAASLVLEPLASIDPDGNLVPRLAAEIPTIENGGLSSDMTTMTWTLREGIMWSDGTALTAEDVKFTADYCMDPEGGCAWAQSFDGIASVEVVDPLTVRLTFDAPRPYPYSAFVGAQTPIIQQAQFADCQGARAPSCTDQNFAPIGTGPFRTAEFLTGDSAVFEANPEYRDPDLPHFDRLTIKGGGDAASAARAVMETGEYDYAWNIQIAPELMDNMSAKGLGRFEVGFGNLIEILIFNSTDPSSALAEGERSTSAHPHPFMTDPAVRQALSMAIDRPLLNEVGYGETGKPSCDLVPNPKVYSPQATDCLTQDIAGANALLDQAGWMPGADGVREKGGVRLSILYQTSVNAVRQDFQALIKQWWSEIGVEAELKAIDPSVYFGGDPASPDTFQKFYADVEMHATLGTGTDPAAFLARNTCGEAPSPKNQWQGQNIPRFCDPDYDALIDELGKVADLSGRGAISRRLGEMITTEGHWILPLIARGTVSVRAASLTGYRMNPWDSELWDVASWGRVR